MTPFIIFTALAAMILLSAASACGPFQVPRLSWYRWFFLFLGSSFIGCLFEMGVVWLGTGVLMSRSSLLYGAVSVVWGLGALLMTVILFPLRRYGGWTVFLGEAILGGGFEYLASLLLERGYHRLFWDYSNLPLNLDGRTNLLYLPEYEVDSVKRLLHFLEQRGELAKLIGAQKEKLGVLIGGESNQPEMIDTSVVLVRYSMGRQTRGTLGVIGPTRMDYPKIVSNLQYLAQSVGGMLNEIMDVGV